MKRLSKIVAVVSVLCLSAALLVACGGGFSAKDLVKGNMDVIYLDKADGAYLKAVELTADEAHQEYLDGLEVEADYFMNFFEIEEQYLTDDQYDTIVSLLGDIYSHSKYTVGDVTKNGDAEVVSVTIEPMNVYFDWLDSSEYEAFLNDWQTKRQSNGFASDAEAENAWTEGIIAGVSSVVSSMTYQPAQTIQVQVTVDSNNYRSIDSSDWGRIDTLMLAYSRAK